MNIERERAVTALRRSHVVRALQHAETVGAMKSALVAARLSALTPTVKPVSDGLDWLREGRTPGCQHTFRSGLPSKPYKQCTKCGFWMARREAAHPGHVVVPPVLKGRVMPPPGDARVHRYVRIKPSAVTVRVDEMEMHAVDIYVRLSKAAARAFSKIGLLGQPIQRWQMVGSVRDTGWWRVDRFLKKKKTQRLDAEELRAALHELIYARPHPVNSAFSQYMAKRR